MVRQTDRQTDRQTKKPDARRDEKKQRKSIKMDRLSKQQKHRRTLPYSSMSHLPFSSREISVHLLVASKLEPSDRLRTCRGRACATRKQEKTR